MSLLIALGACSDTPGKDPVLAQLDELTANAADCGSFIGYTGQPNPSCHTASAQPAVDCLNAAIANGTKATYVIASADSQLFEEDMVFVVVDGTVRTFIEHPGGDRSTDQPYATEEGGGCTTPAFTVASNVCPFDVNMMESHASLTGC
ncbi:MAG: hypothetical protein QM831_00955 [Kofleriaceae bacterium]